MTLACHRAFGVCLLILTFTLPARAEWFNESGDVMGTRVSVDVWHDDAAAGEAAVAAVMSEYRRIDELMSTYKPASEMSYINAHAGRGPVQVTPELFDLISRALELSRLTDGAFDITYESVGYLYDFRQHRRPAADAIRARLAAINYRHVLLDAANRTIAFDHPDVRINLGGIAKGYAVERGARMLAERGIRHGLFNAGGDTRVLGDRRGQPWMVGVRAPRDEDGVLARLPLVDEAISTSGDYERFFEENGRRYHHIINPASGSPTEGIQSVTIIGPDATMTDALSTSVFVMGLEAGMALLATLPAYEGVVIDATGRLSYSAGLVSPE
jgi:thiamine biosynthesis lipoprotein